MFHLYGEAEGCKALSTLFENVLLPVYTSEFTVHVNCFYLVISN